jgi:hypothetical protein
MNITMNDTRIVSIAQVQALAQLTAQVEFKSTTKAETYAWIEETLGKFRYHTCKKKERSVIRGYIMTMTGLSSSQLTRLIARKKKTGKIIVLSTARHSFPHVYTKDDIARLIETDNAHKRLSGPATKHLCKRMYQVYGDERFVRLQNISVSHIYNLRSTRQYTSQSLHFTKTNPVHIPIGERKKPRPNGRPGFLRIDTVHQGDLDKAKGVYHINVVDEVTQWEIVGAVEKISEIYLAPLLEELLEQFPFVIIGFHSDCGSEFINYRVAEMLQRMLVKQTKSRARHCGDNGLVEGKNGAIVRKYFGHGHIPREYAALINEFYTTQLNPYLNFHRPCGFATNITAANGKVTKKYDTYLTPYEKLKSLDNPKQYLKETTDLKCLDILATLENDNSAATAMQRARVELFKSINQKT